MMKQMLHVTGMSRSGTTLLQKMLDAHPKISVLPQPFPLVYRKVKQDFYSEMGIASSPYVLQDLFDETRYSRQEFSGFLGSYSISEEDLTHVFDRMRDWSGQQVKPDSLEFLRGATNETGFEKIVAALLNGLNKELGAEIIGSKEILTEEFVDHLLKKGFKVIHIYRDPRDVITSINFGKGTHYVGDRRPTLFHLRNWRKSIAIRNTFINHANFWSVSYESLAGDHETSLAGICQFLDVDGFSDPREFGSKIPDSEGGGQWEGNSSQGSKSGVSTSSIGNYVGLLSKEMIRYIEHVCFPELHLLHYQTSIDHFEPEFDFASFREPFAIDPESSGLDSSFSSSAEQQALERKRLQLLKQESVSDSDAERYFYSLANWQSLRSALG